jgi:hypothetical protein
VHEEDGVFCDVEGSGFIWIEEGIVDDEETIFGESMGAGVEDLLYRWDIPVVEDIGEEVDVMVLGPGIGEHVEGGGLDAVGEVAVLDGLGGDLVDWGFFEDCGGEVGEVGAEGAAIDAGAAGDIEESMRVMEWEVLAEGLGEEDAPAVHHGGEFAGEGLGFHGFMPVVVIFAAGEVGGLAGVEALEEVEGDGAVFGWGEVGADEPGRVLDEVFVGGWGECEEVVLAFEPSAGDEEGGHDVGGSGLDIEVLADGFEGLGLGCEVGEEVEFLEGGDEHIAGVEGIAVSVDWGGVGGGGEGEVWVHGGSKAGKAGSGNGFVRFWVWGFLDGLAGGW